MKIKISKILFAASIFVIGCAPAPEKKCEGYSCAIAAEATVFVIEQNFLDCNGKTSRVELIEYEGNATTLRIHSVNNINIGKGEFSNPKNGTSMTTKQGEEFIKFGKRDLQDMMVSGFNRTGTVRLEKGINIIHYKYSNCSKIDAGECTVWGVAEEGDRPVWALYSKVLNRKCNRKAVCVNGNITSHEVCDVIKDIAPKVLESDFGKDVVK